MDILVINQDNIIGFVAGCFTTVAVIFCICLWVHGWGYNEVRYVNA